MLSGIALSALIVLLGTIGAHVSSAQSETFATISTTLDVGNRGDDVTKLQRFLATNSLIYPQALITGYYGPLTQQAVTQFQIGYGISPVGRVGPVTLAKINSLIQANMSLDVSSPFISNVDVTTTGNSATLNWVTNEPSMGRVYYGINPVTSFEVSKAKTDPVISGTVASESTTGVNHSVTLSNLNPLTAYSYVVYSADTQANPSIVFEKTFVTK